MVGWISHRNFLSLDGNTRRLTNVCGVVILITVVLKGVIGIHVDDFLIGLADGTLGEKWMSVIDSLCIVVDLGRFRNLNLLESGNGQDSDKNL